MNSPADINSSAVREAIRATGARVTPSRVRVLNALMAAPQPLTHAEIEQMLAQDALSGIDRVTLYRVLDWLADAGLAHKAADARGVFRFSAAKPNSEHSQHAHLRCTGCGGVFCLDTIAPPRPPKLPRGFRFGGVALDIHGECPNCVRHHRHE